MPGHRKRTPDYLRAATGARSKHGAGKPGRKPTVAPVPAPIHLSEVAKRTWAEWEPYLREMGAFRPEYVVALEEACELRSDLLELRKEIETNGRYYTTTNKAGDVMRRPHPASGQLADAQRRLITYLSEFGLTPAGRAKFLGPTGPGKNTLPETPATPAQEFFG